MQPDPAWADGLVRFLTNPLVSPLLLSLGLLGLVFEIKTGAFGLGGLLSLVSLGLFFGSSFLVGLAGWEEVHPARRRPHGARGRGVRAAGIRRGRHPRHGGARGRRWCWRWSAVTRPPATWRRRSSCWAPVSSITVAVAYAWLRHLPNSGRFGGLFLRGGAHQARRLHRRAPAADLVGQDGVAVTDLRPAGTAQIGQERVDVVTEGEYVAQGTRGAGGAQRGLPARGARASQ